MKYLFEKNGAENMRRKFTLKKFYKNKRHFLRHQFVFEIDECEEKEKQCSIN